MSIASKCDVHVIMRCITHVPTNEKRSVCYRYWRVIDTSVTNNHSLLRQLELDVNCFHMRHKRDNALHHACTLKMAWAAKRLANEPFAGLFNGPLTSRFHLLFLIGPLTSRYQFVKARCTFIFLSNVTEVL